MYEYLIQKDLIINVTEDSHENTSSSEGRKEKSFRALFFLSLISDELKGVSKTFVIKEKCGSFA